MKVDLNADMGEGSGSDAELLEVITSANICCGLYAGSAGLMAQTLRAAAAAGVGLGSHPGFDDRANFGRTRMQLSATELTDLIAYQTGAAQAAAQANGLKLRHFKLHGALANMASEDAEMADTCYRAALAVQPHLVLMVLAATAQEQAARALTQQIAAEIFADRAYNADATLVDRSLPGAVLHDPEFAAERILSMLREGAIIAENGQRIPSRIDTICLHGDTPEAVAMARALRARLESAGVTLRAL